jgi:subtilisin family serine protease
MRKLVLGVIVICVAARGDARPSTDECPMDASPLIWTLYAIQAHDTGYTGAGVTVAHFDCGFPVHYEDYLPPGSVDLTYAASFGPVGWGSTSSDQQTPAIYGPHNFHGVAVASSIVGYRGSSFLLDQFGVGPCVPGVAVDAKILPIRAYPRNEVPNSHPLAWIAAGFRYIADLKRAGAFPGGIVVNASFGWDEDDAGMSAAIDDAIDAGVIVVVSAGNSGPAENTVTYPASHARVIAVGAAGFVGERAFAEDPLWFLSYEDPPWFPAFEEAYYVAGFSSRGPEVDVLAPAAWAAWVNFEHRGAAGGPLGTLPSLGPGGTSIAAPQVSGVAALMLEKNPSLRQEDVACILALSARPIADQPLGVWTSLADEQDALLDSFGGNHNVAMYERHVGPPCPTDAPCSIVPPWGASGSAAGLVQAKAALALTPLPGTAPPSCAR